MCHGVSRAKKPTLKNFYNCMNPTMVTTYSQRVKCFKTGPNLILDRTPLNHVLAYSLKT